MEIWELNVAIERYYDKFIAISHRTFGILRWLNSAVNVNPLYTPRENEHQLQDSSGSDCRGIGILLLPKVVFNTNVEAAHENGIHFCLWREVTV